MNRTELACCCLAASAAVLAGLVLTQMNTLAAPAEAALVINRDNLTLMTAQTRSSEDGLFILDNRSQRLLVYTTDAARKRLNLVGNLNLVEAFENAFGGGGGRDRRNPRERCVPAFDLPPKPRMSMRGFALPPLPLGEGGESSSRVRVPAWCCGPPAPPTVASPFRPGPT